LTRLGQAMAQYSGSTKEETGRVAARFLVTAIGGLWVLLILAPPLLASFGFQPAASVLYALFSGICHQSPERVFKIFGRPFAVCHRCTGIYWGFFLGALPQLRRPFPSPEIRRAWILASLVPLAFDALAPYCGMWANTLWSRFLTGLLFGFGASVLLRQGLAEYIAEAPWRTFTSGRSRLMGGIS